MSQGSGDVSSIWKSTAEQPSAVGVRITWLKWDLKKNLAADRSAASVVRRSVPGAITRQENAGACIAIHCHHAKSL